MYGIYAIYDKVAEDIIGGLHLHKHDAAAVRMFADVGSAEGTAIHRHPADYDLLRLAELEGCDIHSQRVDTVLTGAAWIATQQPDIGERHSPVPAAVDNRAHFADAG